MTYVVMALVELEINSYDVCSYGPGRARDRVVEVGARQCALPADALREIRRNVSAITI